MGKSCAPPPGMMKGRSPTAPSGTPEFRQAELELEAILEMLRREAERRDLGPLDGPRATGPSPRRSTGAHAAVGEISLASVLAGAPTSRCPGKGLTPTDSHVKNAIEGTSEG